MAKSNRHQEVDAVLLKVDQGMADYLIGKVSEKPVITLKTMEEQTLEKPMYGHRGLKVELYEVPERCASYILSYIPQCIRQDNILDWMKFRNMLNDNKIVVFFIFLQDEVEHPWRNWFYHIAFKDNLTNLDSNLKFEYLFQNLKLLDEIEMHFLWD